MLFSEPGWAFAKGERPSRCTDLGMVVPLEDVTRFCAALEELHAMPEEKRARMRAAARAYARAYVENPEIKELNVKMFREAMGRHVR